MLERTLRRHALQRFAVCLQRDRKGLGGQVAAKWLAESRQIPALNTDLWEILLHLLEIHRVEIVWVRGHNGHPENERCDRLAVAGAERAKAAGAVV